MAADDDFLTPVNITDHEGQKFPAGSRLDLCIADASEPQAFNGAGYDVDGWRSESTPRSVGLWIVDYVAGDESRITLRQDSDGPYLAKLGQGEDAEIVWDQVSSWWLVCRGEYEKSFRLCNDQGYFLRACSDDKDGASIHLGLCVPSVSEYGASRGRAATSWLLRARDRLSPRNREADKVGERSRSTSPTIVADDDDEAGLVVENIEPVQGSKAGEDSLSGFGRESGKSVANQVDGSQATLRYGDYRRSTTTPQANVLSVRLHRYPPPPMIRPPNRVPPQDVPPQDLPPQDMPPQERPPQRTPPQTIPPQCIPPQSKPPQSVPPQDLPPRDVPPHIVPPQSLPPQMKPPQRVPPPALT